MLVGMASRHDDDATLVAAAKAGDQQAFTLLFERWFDRSYDVAWRIVRNRDTAAEVAQDTLLASWQGLSTLRDEGAFGGWVLRTARNKALNRLQKDGRSGLIDAEDAIDVRGAEAPTPDVALDVTAAERDDLVWAAAATLGERDASLLDLHLRHGLDAAELGEALGVTTNNAHQLLFRLKKKLGAGIRAWVLWHGGRPRCDELAGVLATAGATTFDAATAKVIERHAEGCLTCEERKAAVLAPEAMFAAVPLLPAPLLVRQQVAAALAGQGVPLDLGVLSGSSVGDAVATLQPGTGPGTDLGNAVPGGSTGHIAGGAVGSAMDGPTSVLDAVHDAGSGLAEGHDGTALGSVGDVGAGLGAGSASGQAVAGGAPGAAGGAATGTMAAGAAPSDDGTTRSGSSRRALAGVGALAAVLVVIVLVLLGSGGDDDDPALETAAADASTTASPRDWSKGSTAPPTTVAASSPTTTVAPASIAPPSTAPGAAPSSTVPTVAPPPPTTPTTAPPTTSTAAPSTTTTTAPAPPIVTRFTATEQSPAPVGQCAQSFESRVTLEWVADAADSVTITGPGTVVPPQGADGSYGVCVSPAAQKPWVWTLTATGPGGTATDETRIDPPVIP